MAARCITCANFSGKQQTRGHVALGMFRCQIRPAWEFRDAFVARECTRFVEVPADDLPAREAYETKYGSRHDSRPNPAA